VGRAAADVKADEAQTSAILRKWAQLPLGEELEFTSLAPDPSATSAAVIAFEVRTHPPTPAHMYVPVLVSACVCVCVCLCLRARV
jgi:hypothetical protein